MILNLGIDIGIGQWFLVSISSINISNIGHNIGWYTGVISYLVPQNPIQCCRHMSESDNIWNHGLKRNHEKLVFTKTFSWHTG